MARPAVAPELTRPDMFGFKNLEQGQHYVRANVHIFAPPNPGQRPQMTRMAEVFVLERATER